MSKLDFFQRLDIYDINGDTVSKKTFNAIKELQEQNKIMREALELISATDTSSFPPDLLWYNNWRNNTKERAREALAKVEK